MSEKVQLGVTGSQCAFDLFWTSFRCSGAVCRIQGSVSSAHLNGKQCTLGRQLLADDTHALVHVEVKPLESHSNRDNCQILFVRTMHSDMEEVLDS